MHITDISLTNVNYPALLREINDPPATLHIRGTLPDKNRLMVSIVGSRKPDAYGRYVTHMIAGELAHAGVVIVSGLAYGIDAVAHLAALDAGGTTVAVLGSGVDLTTPSANHALGERIIAHGGALISEQPNGTPALAHHIIARNRIVAGISSALVVTQAAIKSGTLHTARFAADYNRPIFAIPGHITLNLSTGPNNLIRENRATAVTSSLDILQELQYTSGPTPVLHSPSNAAEATIFDLLGKNINTTQAIIEASGLGASEVANTISIMEITGKLTNLGAGHWAPRLYKS